MSWLLVRLRQIGSDDRVERALQFLGERALRLIEPKAHRTDHCAIERMRKLGWIHLDELAGLDRIADYSRDLTLELLRQLGELRPVGRVAAGLDEEGEEELWSLSEFGNTGFRFRGQEPAPAERVQRRGLLLPILPEGFFLKIGEPKNEPLHQRTLVAEPSDQGRSRAF